MKTTLWKVVLAGGMLAGASVAYAQQAPITSPGETPRTLQRDQSGTPGTGSQNIPPGGGAVPSAAPAPGMAPSAAPPAATTGAGQAPISNPAQQPNTQMRDSTGTPGTGSQKKPPG